MHTIKLFTDASVNPQIKVGFGAFLIVDENNNYNRVEVQQFTDTSSSKIELETLLFALKIAKIKTSIIEVYTDSQSVISLLERRVKLEKNKFVTGKGTLLKNYELYQEFYQLIDELNCKFIKVKGHKKSKEKDDVDRIFTLVDRASRKALREFNSESCRR